MATTTHTTTAPRSPVVGETVHYRASGRCWAAVVLDAEEGQAAQLYLFPLPPAVAKPQSPGTFVAHGSGGHDEETWHQLAECPSSRGGDGAGPGDRRRRRGRRANHSDDRDD